MEIINTRKIEDSSRIYGYNLPFKLELHRLQRISLLGSTSLNGYINILPEENYLKKTYSANN